MTVYFVGGEIGAWTPADSDASEVASAASLGYDSAFSRTAVYVNGGASSSQSATFAAPDAFWFHLEMANKTSNASYKYFYLRSATTDLVRVGFNSSGIKVDAWIAAAWTAVIPAATVGMGADSRQAVDVYVNGNTASGTIALYINGTLRDSQSANLAAVVGITNIKIAGAATYGGSQFCLANEPTTGWRVMTYVPTGSGATVDFTGDYTAIDEKVNSDADFIYSGTVNQVELATTTATGSVTGYTPRAVGVYCRAKCGVGGPQNLQLALRSAGTTYFSASKALNVGYGSYGNVWNTDPATSAAFLAAALASLQPGVKSIT